MKEISEFRIGLSRTLNLGNFESLRVEALVVVSVPEGADYEELRARAQPELRKLLEETYRAQHKPNK